MTLHTINTIKVWYLQCAIRNQHDPYYVGMNTEGRDAHAAERDGKIHSCTEG